MPPRPSPPIPRRAYGAIDDATAKARGALPSAAADYRCSPSTSDGTSLGIDQSLSSRTRQKGIGRQRSGFAIMGVLVVGAAVVGLTYKRAPTDATAISSASSAEAGARVVPPGAMTSLKSSQLFPKVLPRSPREELSPLDFTALNPYHVRDGKPAQDYLWLKDVKLIEPYRETTLGVSAPREGFEYRWKVFAVDDKGAAGELTVEESGPEAVVVLTVLGDHVVFLEEVDAEGEVVRRLKERVAVKYVRREIRTLTDDEREELLDAMYTLWAVPVDGGKGKELYGEGYADIYAINRLHYKAASPIDCDHFHEGLGFLTNHALISNTFEYSLQRVNPKLTLPYWDFTIEGSLIGDSDQADVVNLLLNTSPIFKESWFGTYDPEDNQVKDGRWANTEIPSMMENNPGHVTPDVYGKLRAPWNTNNREYLSRGMGKMCGENVGTFYPWPTCESHYDMVTSYEDFYSWVWASGFDPHGPVHIWIGGVMDCEETYDRIEDLTGEAQAETLAMYSFVHRKNLYREGLFQCEGAAALETSPEQLVSGGQCGCLNYDLTRGRDYEAMYDAMMGLSDVIGDFDVSTRRQVVKAFCDSTIGIGDNLQAGSSLDPTFWATHPTMERLWMYTVLTGQITDFDWPDASSTYVDSKGKAVTEELSLYGDTCTGHAGSDVFPYGILDADIDDFTIKTGIRGSPEHGNILTNREVLEAFDPRVDMLPYVYDTFEWAHCAADGFDFGDATDSAKSKNFERAKRPVFEQGAPRAPRYRSIMDLLAESKRKRTGQA